MTARRLAAAAVLAAAAACRPPAPPALRPSSAAPTVRLVTETPQVAPGAGVELRLVASGAPPVFAVPFHLTFDPAVLRYESAHEGAWLRSDGKPTTFLAALSGAGRLVVGVSRLGAVGGIEGGGEVCTIRFVAVGPGDARLAFERNALLDPKGKEIPASFEAARLAVR